MTSKRSMKLANKVINSLKSSITKCSAQTTTQNSHKKINHKRSFVLHSGNYTTNAVWHHRKSNTSQNINSTNLRINHHQSTHFLTNQIFCHQQNRCIHGNVNSYNFDPNPDSDGAKIGEVVLTTKKGTSVLLDPLLNKGTGFGPEERERLSLRGLVPSRIIQGDVLEYQVKRIMKRYWELTSPISKYSYIIALQDRNETLFYKCLSLYLEELAPIIYTPTVGIACQSYGFLFRRPRGMYFSSLDKHMMHSMTFNWPTDDVEIIVVTDGSRILGLGDLGTNGMGIPIGKLSLYVAGAGIHPSKCLPVVIDVGTNNESLLNDPMYLGLQQKRLTGPEFMSIIDEFMRAVKERFPKALIQFEDFSNQNAARILNKYRNKQLCFNDDIQGTGCVALAGLLCALRVIDRHCTNPGLALLDQRIVIMGAGSAGIGVASAILHALQHEGLTLEQAHERIWLLDSEGSLGLDRPNVTPFIQPWLRNVPDKIKLESLIEIIKPTALLGLTGVGGLFTEQSIRTMSRYCKHPIVFPLSNPTDKAECTAQQAYEWTDGNAVFASGSPFQPVTHKGRTYIPGQANNMYTFPGIGLGALVCQTKSITDSQLFAAALGLANAVTNEDLDSGRIYPRIREIPRISAAVAFELAKQAQKEGLAQSTFNTDEELKKKIQDRMWTPAYGSLVRVD